jgi:hypothetical protein
MRNLRQEAFIGPQRLPLTPKNQETLFAELTVVPKDQGRAANQSLRRLPEENE